MLYGIQQFKQHTNQKVQCQQLSGCPACITYLVKRDNGRGVHGWNTILGVRGGFLLGRLRLRLLTQLPLALLHQLFVLGSCKKTHGTLGLFTGRSPFTKYQLFVLGSCKKTHGTLGLFTGWSPATKYQFFVLGSCKKTHGTRDLFMGRSPSTKYQLCVLGCCKKTHGTRDLFTGQSPSTKYQLCVLGCCKKTHGTRDLFTGQSPSTLLAGPDDCNVSSWILASLQLDCEVG